MRHHVVDIDAETPLLDPIDMPRTVKTHPSHKTKTNLQMTQYFPIRMFTGQILNV